MRTSNVIITSSSTMVLSDNGTVGRYNRKFLILQVLQSQRRNLKWTTASLCLTCNVYLCNVKFPAGFICTFGFVPYPNHTLQLAASDRPLDFRDGSEPVWPRAESTCLCPDGPQAMLETTLGISDHLRVPRLSFNHITLCNGSSLNLHTFRLLITNQKKLPDWSHPVRYVPEIAKRSIAAANDDHTISFDRFIRWITAP